MFDIIILFFLCRKIKNIAIEKNLTPTRWIIYTILAWFVCEGIGFNIAMGWNGFSNIKSVGELTMIVIGHPDIILFSLFCAFGGYLIVRKILERKSAMNS